MKVTPCKDCPRKGCGSYHDKCPEYQKWKAYTNEIKKKEYERKEADLKFKRYRFDC